MADTISRAYILEALGHLNDYVHGDPHFLNGIETAKEITENAPTVDAVPVVRCKDCWKRGLDNCPMEFYWDSHPADDVCYCAMGERREDTSWQQ